MRRRRHLLALVAVLAVPASADAAPPCASEQVRWANSAGPVKGPAADIYAKRAYHRLRRYEHDLAHWKRDRRKGKDAEHVEAAGACVARQLRHYRLAKRTVQRRPYVSWGKATVSREMAWVMRTARERGWQGGTTGRRAGARTYADQASLYFGGYPAFPPWGPSRHLRHNLARKGYWAQAVDVSDSAGLIRHAPVRLHVRYSWEEWHVESVRRYSIPGGIPR